MAFFGYFLAKIVRFHNVAKLYMTFPFWFSMGRNCNTFSWCFAILTFFGHFWQIFLFLPKMAKKGQNDKTPATHVAGPPHWKSARKSGLELGSVAKTAVFGQKVPKKCHLVLRLVRYCESDSRFWIFRIFQYNKVVLVSGFLAKIKKRHFLPQKMPFFTFGCFLPFSMAFLWPLTSWFAPNFRNQVRKPDFGRWVALLLNTLGKKGKNQKTVLPDTFFWFDSFQHTK